VDEEHRVPRNRRLARGLLAAVAVALLAGCGGGGSSGSGLASADVLTSPAPTTSSPAGPSVAPTASSSTAATKSPASASTAKKSTGAVAGTVRTGSTGGCGGGRSSAWASWPMPNPRGLGLPNPAAYTDLGNGSVKDKVTCLVWQKGYSPEKLSWAAAKTYCGSLSTGGSGWRLPSRIELTSIFDFTRSGPAINTTVFKGVANFFWTSSPWAVAHTPKYAWAMNFYEGLTTNAGNTTGSYYARCVKAPTGSGAATYKAVATGERQDNQTGLIWQQATSKNTMSAAAAKTYCAGLALGSHRWRLPSIKELATTVDESRVAPAINRSVFPGTAKSTYYCSSSKSAAKPSATWGLNYDDGFTSYYNVTTGYARCVR
jgi:Protein of unknown function (DUF1566)